MDAPATFLEDVSSHSMLVFKDDGLYRHVRFRRPDTMCMHFDLITWPGYLCYTGDMGTYVFSRLSDMFEFFRRNSEKQRYQIDMRYWSEKLQSADKHDPATEFSPEQFKAVINEYRVRWMKESARGDSFGQGTLTKEQRRELWEAVDEQVLNNVDYGDGEHAVFTSAHEFREHDYYFEDLWEHNFRKFTHRFSWCCCALAWGIAQYDLSKEHANETV